MKKKALLGLLAALLFLTGCARNADTEETSFLSKADLEGSTLYVHNVTCSKVSEMRTVTDPELLKKVVEISVTAERFRPTTSRDVILGEKPDVYYVLENGDVKYTFSFFQVERQLDIGFVHRDSPLIDVSKTVAGKPAENGDEYGWYCSLSAADYAGLYETLQRYSEGDIVS